MANLGIFKINTNGEYKTIEEVTDLSFEEGKTYFMQVQNVGGYLTTCISDTTPQNGGFIMQSGEKFKYTPLNGVNLYLNTNAGEYNSVFLNIAE